MINLILKWWRARQLRRAQENYALWKARAEEGRRQLQTDLSYAANPYNRHSVIRAAGQEAKYLERVEYFVRNQ